MPVSQQLTERLIPFANAQALDVLYRSGGQFPAADQAPSTELVQARWSEMNASSAENIADAATDPALLDFIAVKDKRKGVRYRVATNPHTHPVTKWYFVQEALRADDRDLLTGVFVSMTSADRISAWINDPSLQRRISKKYLVEALLDNGDVGQSAALLASFNDDAAWIMSMMLEHDTDRALAVIDTAGLDLSTLPARSWYGSKQASLPAIRRLLAELGSRAEGRFYDEFFSSSAVTHEVITAIDPGLYDLYVKNVRVITPDDVDAIVAVGRTEALFAAVRGGARLAGEATIRRLVDHVTNDADRATLALGTVDDELAARLVGDPNKFIEGIGTYTQSSGYLSFVRKVLPRLAPEVTVTLLRAAEPARLNASEITMFADMLKLGFLDLIEQLPSPVLRSLNGLPGDVDVTRLRNLANAAGEETELHIAALLLQHHDDDDVRIRSFEAIIIAAASHDDCAQLVLDAPEGLVEPLLPTHRGALVDIFNTHAHHVHRVSWAPLLVNHIRARSGWGQQIQSRNITAAAMEHLQQRIGDDTRWWETALSLLGDWTGTLDELVDSASML